MFQIEPIIWLQSLGSPAITWIMTTVSSLGYTPVYASLLIVLIFGIRLKKSLFVFLALVICGILTDSLKRGIMFPRPTDVDIRVIEPGFIRDAVLVDQGGAKSFWAFPSKEAVKASKLQTDRSYGFPSGHVSSAVVFFIGLAFFFRSRKVFVFAIFWIVLMALSRMYLGRHFIADVLGGIGVGLCSVGLAAFLVHPLRKEGTKSANYMALPRWTLFVVSLFSLSFFTDLLDKENIGRLLGLFATFAVLLRLGFPRDEAKYWKRIVRVILAVVAYVALDPLLERMIESMGYEDNSLGMLLSVFLGTFIPLTATVLLACRLKLYESRALV